MLTMSIDMIRCCQVDRFHAQKTCTCCWTIRTRMNRNETKDGASRSGSVCVCDASGSHGERTIEGLIPDVRARFLSLTCERESCSRRVRTDRVACR